MSTFTTKRSITAIAVVGLLLVLLGTVVAMSGPTHHPRVTAAPLPLGDSGGRGRSVRFDADYDTYPDLASLVAASDLVIIGTVGSPTVVPDPNPAVGEDGSTLPTVPTTFYPVAITEYVKGKTNPSVTVKIAGGRVGDEEFVEEVPPLDVGGTYLFFTIKDPDDTTSAFPLAGGHALTMADGSPSFTMSGDVSGADPFSFTLRDVQALAGSPTEPTSATSTTTIPPTDDVVPTVIVSSTPATPASTESAASTTPDVSTTTVGSSTSSTPTTGSAGTPPHGTTGEGPSPSAAQPSVAGAGNSRGAVLPRTGSDFSRLAWTGVAMVVIGLGLVACALSLWRRTS